MIVVGLTGSIAMGKTTVASIFSEFGVPVFDADAAVRDFYSGDSARSVEEMFPGVLVAGRVDRERLAKFVLSDVGALRKLEGLVHPAVGRARSDFVEDARLKGRRLAVIDIPLLFETGDETAFDIIIVVSAPERIQRARALSRKGMTEEKFVSLLSEQLSDLEKRQRGHFTIHTSETLEKTRAQVSQFLRSVAGLDGCGNYHA